MPPDQTSFEERTILAADGLALYARDYRPTLTDKSALLCLPGMTRNAKDFAQFAATAGAGRRVICPDYRGRGRSAYDPDWRHYEPAVHVGDLLQMLTALDLHRVIVVGTSLGGFLAMGLAIARPTVIAGVVLNDIGPEVGGAGLGRIFDYVGRDRPQPDWAAARAEMQRVFAYLELGDAANWDRMARATYREDTDGRLHFDWDVRLVRPMKRALRRGEDLWRYFRALRPFPTLALRGEMSAVLSDDTLTLMRAAHPMLETAVVPRVGHTPNLGEPEAIAALGSFFDRLP